MARRLDWEKIQRERKAGKPFERRPPLWGDSAIGHDSFARVHRIACFVCGARFGPWGATGFRKNDGKPYGICKRCLGRKREER
jgi:hypothetical protein